MIAQANGITTRYEMSGAASAPVLLFSHSLGVSLDMWRAQQAALANAYRVVSYDTRGHGGSSVAAGPHFIEVLGNDVLALLDVLKIDRVHFCGLSLGGIIGQWLGIHAPDRLHSLVLANTAAKIGTAESWNARIATVEKEGMDAIIAGTLERWLTAGFRSRNPEIVRNVESMLRKTEASGYLGCCAAIRDADLRSAASQIQAPTLLIASKEDPVTTSKDMQDLARSIPNASYIELEGAHLSSIESEADFTGALRAFLAKVLA